MRPSTGFGTWSSRPGDAVASATEASLSSTARIFPSWSVVTCSLRHPRRPLSPHFADAHCPCPTIPGPVASTTRWVYLPLLWCKGPPDVPLHVVPGRCRRLSTRWCGYGHRRSEHGPLAPGHAQVYRQGTDEDCRRAITVARLDLLQTCKVVVFPSGGSRG